MARGASAQIRQALFQVHLWLAVALSIPLVLLGLTGSALMFPDVVERLTNPVPVVERPADPALAPGAYVAAAQAALPSMRITGLKMPARPGSPVEVTGAGGGSGPGAGRSVWLDPATGQVLKAGPTRSRLFAFSHDFHGAFLLQGGRPLVGWAGVAMLILSVSGLWLWWPRGAFLKGFRWRRTPDTLNNLHHMAGFWLSVPLALISLTGIFISFPSVTGAVFGAPPQQAGAPRPPGGEGPGRTAPPRLTADQVLMLAQAGKADAKLVSMSYPGAGGGRGQASVPKTAWRVQLRSGAVLVDDATQTVSPVPPARPRQAPSGLRGLIRPVHEGEVSGAVWRWLVFAAGIVPALLAFSGIYLWIRNEARKARSRRAAS